MKSHYNLLLSGQCESHQCSSIEVGRCTREGKLYFVTSEQLRKSHGIPWEQYSCQEALEIDQNNGFICEEITGVVD